MKQQYEWQKNIVKCTEIASPSFISTDTRICGPGLAMTVHVL
jgi:hypothetical protein